MPNALEAFRYAAAAEHWYKGNTHIHSLASDGGKSIREIAELYAGADYDFLFCTDHWVASETRRLQADAPLLLMDGMELNGCDSTGANFHVVCLGNTEGIAREDGLEQAMQAARTQHALLVLAHPHWCGNSLEDANRWDFDGVEVYNHVCHWMNGKSHGAVHWDAMLRQKPDTLAFAVDDAHLCPEHPGWNGGWIVVNAAELSQDAILDAIRRGRFFSSCGPAFTSIGFDGHDINITTTPVRFIRLVGPEDRGRRAGSFDGPLLTEASLEAPTDWEYAYLEIEDREGRRAWSNPLFIDDLR